MDTKPEDNKDINSQTPESPLVGNSAGSSSQPRSSSPPVSQDSSPVPAQTMSSEAASPANPPVQDQPSMAIPASGHSEPPAGKPTVVVPQNSSRLPFWFYLLFALVLIVFLSVSFLLVRTLLEKRSAANSMPQSASASPPPKVAVTPSLAPSPPDEYLQSVNSFSVSDETGDIEADINATDSTSLEEDFQALDQSFGAR